MGVTSINGVVMNPQYPKRKVQIELLVDSGAEYSVVPGDILKKLGMKPHRTLTFRMADGSTTSRRMGDMIFEHQGIRGASPVVFGKKGDATLLGVITLETLGFMLDPLQRKLLPMKLHL